MTMMTLKTRSVISLLVARNREYNSFHLGDVTKITSWYHSGLAVQGPADPRKGGIVQDILKRAAE